MKSCSCETNTRHQREMTLEQRIRLLVRRYRRNKKRREQRQQTTRKR